MNVFECPKCGNPVSGRKCQTCGINPHTADVRKCSICGDKFVLEECPECLQ